MAGSLESVLARIPGYGGYLAKKRYDEQSAASEQEQQIGQLQQAHTLQSILAQMQARQQQEQMRGAMAESGGDPEKALELALKSGNMKAAQELTPLVKMKQEQRMKEEATRGMRELNAPMPAPAQPMGDPKLMPAGEGAVTAAPAAPANQRVAHLQKMMELYASHPAVVQRIQAQIGKIESDEKSSIEKRTAAAERSENQPLVPIIGPDGKSVLVPRSQAVGKRPAQPSIAGGGEFSPEALRMTAEQYLTGDRQAIQGYARNSSARIALQNEIVKVAKEKGFSGADVAAQMADFAGIMSGSRTVGSRAAQIELASSEAEKMIDIVLERSKAFERTQFVPVNKALKAFETQTGQPEVKAFGAAINSLVNVYARAINPTGVATRSDKDHAREMLAAADSPAQVQAVMDVMRQEMKAARAAPGEVRAATRKAVTGNEAAPATTPAAAPTSGAGWNTEKERRYQELLKKRGS